MQVSPSKIPILAGEQLTSFKSHFSKKQFCVSACYTAAMQLVTPRAVAMAVRIEMAV